MKAPRYSAKGDCSVELVKTGMLKDVNKRCVELDQELAKRISDGGLVLAWMLMVLFPFLESATWVLAKIFEWLAQPPTKVKLLNYPDFGHAQAQAHIYKQMISTIFLAFGSLN